MQPQLISLEARISALAGQLSDESTRRVLAGDEVRGGQEQARASWKGELRGLGEENEDLWERLKFLEGEAEDRRRGTSTERGAGVARCYEN